MSAGDLATLVVALGTVALAAATYRQVHLSRSSLDLSVRPFLADPLPPTREGDQEELLFGAPGRISVQVAQGELFYQGEGSDTFYLSVAFENIGAGVAAIVGAETDPAVPGDINVSRKFVPVGAIVRVNLSVLTELPGAERFRDQWWAIKGFSVLIRYADTNGKQTLTSTASIGQAATQAPFVKEIAVFREGDSTPIAIGRGSY